MCGLAQRLVFGVGGASPTTTPYTHPHHLPTTPPHSHSTATTTTTNPQPLVRPSPRASRIMSSSAGDPLSLILRYGQPSLCVDGHQLRVISHLVEALGCFMRGTVRDFIARHRGTPMLVTYGSDCTPVSTRTRYRFKFKSKEVARSGITCGIRF